MEDGISPDCSFFQSTPPRRRRPRRYEGRKGNKFFNPRLREGGDRRLIIWMKKPSFFNPRLREGGDFSSLFTRDHVEVFNPRLREGGDANFIRQQIIYPFSIHASAKEATIEQGGKKMANVFSIHASAKEATHFACFLMMMFVVFNPRLREGGDRNIL